MGRQPKALLQRCQRESLPLVGLLQPAQHRLVARQPAAHIQRLDHQAGGGITVTAMAQLLPQLPPALIGEQLLLVAAVQQRPGLTPQRIDQMLQVDAPRPPMALDAAMAPHQFAGDLAAEQQMESIMEDPHRQPLADQPRRHRIHDSAHLNRAGAPHRELLDVVVGKAKARQRPQRRSLLLQPHQTRSVVLLKHRSQESLVRSQRLKIAAAAQQKRLLDPPLEMAMGTLHTAVLMRHSQVVAAVGQAVVAAEGVIAGSDVG